ncbi:MAG: hypothetical protein V7739_21700 [Motiliproteus sp.]
MIKKILPFALIFTCMSALAVELPSSKEDLLSQFLSAHESKNYDEISTLINWDGVRKYKKKIIRVYTKNNFGRKVAGSEFEEADTEFLNKFSVGQKKYKTNMQVTHLMRIFFENATGDDKEEYDSVVYLVGKDKDSYQISIAIKNNPEDNSASH